MKRPHLDEGHALGDFHCLVLAATIRDQNRINPGDVRFNKAQDVRFLIQRPHASDDLHAHFLLPVVR